MPWLPKPPTSATWIIDDTLNTLIRLGHDTVGPPSKNDRELMKQGFQVYRNERLWERLLSCIGPHSKEAYRARLHAALRRCQGCN